MDTTEFLVAYGKVVSRSWSDESYRAQLFAEPQATLAAAGITAPETARIELVEMNPAPGGDPNAHVARWTNGAETGVYTMLIPTRPDFDTSDETLGEDLLAAVAGGASAETAAACCCCSPCCCCGSSAELA
jgi:hypothetical protein